MTTSKKNTSKKLYVDVSVYENTTWGRGIDRVILKFFKANNERLIAGDIVPIAWHHDKGYILASKTLDKLGVKRQSLVVKLFNKIAPFIVPNYFLVRIRRSENEQLVKFSGLETVGLKEGEAIFCIDTCWSLGPLYLEYIQDLHSKEGVQFIPLYYDLIPVNHAQFVHIDLQSAFPLWLDVMAKISQKSLAISDETAREVENYVSHTNGGDVEVVTTYLGSDFMGRGTENTFLSRGIQRIFENSQRPVYVVVGSIEPRKSHEFVYEAFRSLWEGQSGFLPVLVFIGSVNPLLADFVSNIKKSPHINNSIFIEHGADDAALAFCLANASGLISASHAEGFDLPVAEARAFGTPLIVSNTSVHREIAGDAGLYFDPTSQEDFLAAITSSLELNHQTCAGVKQWMGWSEAGKNMYNTLVEISV